MKSHRKELWFETPGRTAYLNITPHVEEALGDSGVQEGLCLVNAMHISASVFVNDDERGLQREPLRDPKPCRGLGSLRGSLGF